MQLVEELTDRQAADAVRGQIDWQYALDLELSDPGVDFSVLCEFRERLLAGQVERVLLDALLEVFKQKGWLKAGGQQRRDSTHVIAAIRTLNSLVVVAPAWLRPLVTAEWFDRSALPFVNDRLPKRDGARQALAEAIGRDGFQRLDAVYSADAPAWLREIPAIGVLQQVWIQQYAMLEPTDLPPCAKRIHSP
jgi:transposase